jgi:uncharacterized delta-60 repeat protein
MCPKIFPNRTFDSLFSMLFIFTLSVSIAFAQKGKPSGCPVIPPNPTDTKCYLGSGCLDTSFNLTGYRVGMDDPTLAIGIVNKVLIQSDGKIVIVGQGTNSNGATGTDMFVARLNSDGSRDIEFGDADPLNPLIRRGYTLINVGSDNHDRAQAGVLLPDGKIVAGGWDYPDYATIVRLNADGSLDTSFGSGGSVQFQNPNLHIQDMAVQSDGEILLAGGDLRFTVVRLNSNGSIDSEFGNGGTASVNPSTSSKGSGGNRTMAIQTIVSGSTTEERIVLGGGMSDKPVGGFRFGLVRFTSIGTLDTSFGTGGRASALFSEGTSNLNAVAIDSSNRIVAVGEVTASCGGSNHAYARFTQNGALDSSFSGDGRFTHDVYGYDDYANSVAIQDDGKIVAGGQARPTSSLLDVDFSVVRLQSNGSLDGGFGVGLSGFFSSGIVTTSMVSTTSYGRSIAIQPDGRIVLGGSASNNGATFAVARYFN